MSSSDDEDLKLAMAMSLQESPAAATRDRGAIDLTSDTDDDGDEDLRRAIALSIQEGGVKETARPTTTNTAAPTTNTSTSSTATEGTTGGFMGIDRKAMERDRLARLGKRKRDPSPERPSKQITKPSAVSELVNRSTLQYPKGAIKRTFARAFPRTDDITIDEVLEASTINIAVISSFQYETAWLYEKLDPLKVKQIWLMNAKGQDLQQKMIREREESGVPSSLKLHFPPMGGMIYNMHSKFMLLFGKEKLRVVVPTANMTRTDWGEVANDWQPGVMENSVFLIDMPRRKEDTVGEKKDLTPFGRELMYFLEEQEVGPKVTGGLLKFDFSQTNHLAFIHAIGGPHTTERDHPTGLPGLAQAIRDIQCDGVEHIELDYAASSIGAVNDTFLSRIYLAACGESFTTDNATIPNVRDHIRIYFPTDETVQKSEGGPDCAGIISLSGQYYNASTFPKECLRDYDSNRRGMLSHNKLLFARGRKKDGKPFAWVYVGSANISESAWGGQKVLKSGKMGSLNIRNWECGVVMPVPNDKLQRVKLRNGEVPPMSVFEGTIEVPFHHPGNKYDGRQPWFFRPG